MKREKGVMEIRSFLLSVFLLPVLAACAPEPTRLLLSTEPGEGQVMLVVRAVDLSGHPTHPPDAGPARVSVSGPLSLDGVAWAEFGPDGVARIRLLETGSGKARIEVMAGDLPAAALEVPVGTSGGSQEALKLRLPLAAWPEG